jgi:hypothetical protein
VILKSSDKRIVLVNIPRKSPSYIGIIEETNRVSSSFGRRVINVDLSNPPSYTDLLSCGMLRILVEIDFKLRCLKISSLALTAYSFKVLFYEGSSTFSRSST